jgi:hypothetical protein
MSAIVIAPILCVDPTRRQGMRAKLCRVHPRGLGSGMSTLHQHQQLLLPCDPLQDDWPNNYGKKVAKHAM